MTDPTEGFASDEKPALDGPTGEYRPAYPEAVSARLLDAHAALEDALRGQEEERARIRGLEDLTESTNVQGVAVGHSHASGPDTRVGGGAPGDPALVVYLGEGRPAEHVRSLVVEEMGVNAATVDEVGVIPVETGLIRPLLHDFRLRPAPGGISVGHVDLGGSGTLGCLVTGRSSPRSERTLILSNNHVLGRSNLASLNDCICQPGPGDGGTCPDDQVAVFERYVTLSFGGGAVNYVDCATAWAWPDRVRPDLLYRTPSGPTFFPFSNQPVAAVQNMAVGKSGRTTEVTVGYVTALGASFWVGPYEGGQNAFFAGQLQIEATSGLFSDGGDSGSLIWAWDVNRNPVGLLFAGAGTVTWANPIDFVLNALDVNLLT